MTNGKKTTSNPVKTEYFLPFKIDVSIKDNHLKQGFVEDPYLYFNSFMILM